MHNVQWFYISYLLISRYFKRFSNNFGEAIFRTNLWIVFEETWVYSRKISSFSFGRFCEQIIWNYLGNFSDAFQAIAGANFWRCYFQNYLTIIANTYLYLLNDFIWDELAYVILDLKVHVVDYRLSYTSYSYYACYW